MKEIIEKIIYRFIMNYGKISYSQCGEDIIIEGIFKQLGIKNPKYIDIGAHHPTLFSNTYTFYKKGSRGVCIEPDPELFKKIKNKRSRDICLNVGISDKNQTQAPYYVMTAKTLNTFSKKESDEYQRSKSAFGDQKVEEIKYIDLVSVDELFKKYFKDFPDFLSIDTEGMDEVIIKSIDFKAYRPKVICTEIIEQIGDDKFVENKDIIKLLENNGYIYYANTHINGVFVDKNLGII